MVRRRLPLLARRMTEIPIGFHNRAAAGRRSARHTPRARRCGVQCLNGPLAAHFGLVYPVKGWRTLA